MLFKTKLLAGCVAGLLASSVAFADSSVEFKGYARAGFDLNLTKIGRDFNNPGQDGQGEKGLSTRHVRNLNYLQLWVTKNLENSKFVISVDNEIFQTVYTEDSWDNISGFRVRDAYFQTEVSPDLAIWAGQRYFLFDDVRVLDVLNNYNAFGAGLVIAKNTDVFVSTTKTGTVVSTDGTATKKDLQFVAHSKIELSPSLSLSPELAVTRSGDVLAAQQNAATGEVTLAPDAEGKAVKLKSAKTAFKGRLLVGFTGSDMWNNAAIAYEQTPNLVCENGACLPNNKLSTITFTDSGSFEFGSVGLLVGALVKYEKYKNKITFQDKKGKEKNAKSRVVASVDVQPVFYVTDKFHLALDINKTFRPKYKAGETPAALLVTPIARYALAKNTIGQAQVYTSVTYGKYDVKNSVFNGKKFTDSLVTMQTGFELAF